MAAAASLIPHIHHEKQEPGSMLCAQHALNALLQGNLYDPSQLADIAKQLDELERVQVDNATWQARDRDSLNMDDTGFFSVSVLESALEVWGLRLLRWRSEDMRIHHAKPEEQLAFVLNLDSHWFTIRSFSGGYWFNLNSFLETPSWVGSSYLGALLGAAESEGYSVFVVAQADDTRQAFHSSLADECAATLPPASVASGSEESGSASTVLDSNAQGLRPSIASSSTSAAAPTTSLIGEEDEEADLQAALRASLAEADAVAAQKAVTAASTTSDEERSSRLHSPSIVGQRRTRGGMFLGDHEMTSADQQDEETDDQVDAIAPSRRRARGLAPTASATASASSSSRGSPYILPTASGGRRRVSRQLSEDGEQASFRRRRQQQQQSRQQQEASGGGTSYDDAISIDEDDTSLNAGAAPSSSETVRRLIAPVAIDVDEESDDDDDFAHVAVSAPRSPFLNPALVRSGGSTNSDDDFHSLSSADEEANLGESWVQSDIEAIRRQTVMQDRAYDDEDAQLQAALAASMRDTGVSTDSAPAAVGDASSTTAGHSFENELAAASWINEEDSRAIREAQASFASTMARQASSRSEKSPPPPDVEKIARMRAEAKRKAEEEEEARLRGEDTTQATAEAADAADALKKGLQQMANAEGGEEDDESDDDEPQLSPEEIRRARLARFGA